MRAKDSICFLVFVFFGAITCNLTSNIANRCVSCTSFTKVSACISTGQRNYQECEESCVIFGCEVHFAIRFRALQQTAVNAVLY